MFDFKKEQKELYGPKTTPEIVNVPTMIFLTVEGTGNPNTSQAFKTATEALYSLSYSIKMSKMDNKQPKGYYDYVVPPLEGFWWFKNGQKVYDGKKENLCWTIMLRQPEFVTEKVFEEAKLIVNKKKPNLDLKLVKYEQITEGYCAQLLHIGSYDDEKRSINALEDFIKNSKYQVNTSNPHRIHKEIYLSNPQKVAAAKLKTIIRYPIKKI